MTKTISFKKLSNGELNLYEVAKGKTKGIAMLATLLPNSQAIHNEIIRGHNI